MIGRPTNLLGRGDVNTGSVHLVGHRRRGISYPNKHTIGSSFAVIIFVVVLVVVVMMVVCFGYSNYDVSIVNVVIA